MAKKENPGQCRREVFVQTGIAFLALIAKRFIPMASPDGHVESGVSTNSQKKSDEASKSTAPTAADFVKLGEHLSYLSNLPTGARVFDAVREIGGFLEILRDRRFTGNSCGGPYPLEFALSQWLWFACAVRAVKT